ncbi:unnamed protein product [Parnassius mnemosyne]|uniref:Uncharacterized protein n=1 Tax=Parnassius mnemosyne TaxID=213953 RepID=A0AAV1M723_9NEOP
MKYSAVSSAKSESCTPFDGIGMSLVHYSLTKNACQPPTYIYHYNNLVRIYSNSVSCTNYILVKSYSV